MLNTNFMLSQYNTLQESHGAYGTADKKSIKLRMNRQYTVQVMK